MSKIMLVEDDNSLLEIYEARLKAEGYDIVTARDGEEALTVALKEHPDLIIADVMMPKVSGFDMVDILRSTPETKATKIIMMTALNQAEDKARAEKLGADKYLVKSQVTLEDVARIVHDVLAEQDAVAAAAVTSATGVEPSVAKPKTVSAIPIVNPSSTGSIPSKPTNTTNTPVVDPSTAPKTVEPRPASNTKTPTAIPVTPPPEPTKSAPLTSMPKVADQQPPAVQIETTSSSPTTSIPVISDDSNSDSDNPDLSIPAVKDPFLAQNPTLSDSPNVALPAEKSKPAADTNEPPIAENSIVQQAVESLAPSTTTSDSTEIPKQDPSEDSTTTKYLKTDKDDKSKSMTHNKVIEPTLAQEEDDSLTLTNLSEIPDTEVASTPPPPVNTIIAPDPDKGPANSSQN